MIKVILFFVLFSGFQVHAGDKQRRTQLISIIDEQIIEINRVGKSIQRRPQMLLRLAELLLEKARILKENENERYLSIPIKKRIRVNKKKIFAHSRQYFFKAQTTCNLILSKFPNYKYKGDVYYILAFNAKEFQKNKKAKSYFRLAARSAHSDKTILSKSYIALANMHYNDFEYSKAIPLFNKALNKINDKWWTKDAHNLAWSYYQTGEYKKGIKILRKIIKLSKNRNYINMSKKATKDLAMFYTQSGQIKKAVSFYKKQSKNVQVSLLNLGRVLMGKSKYTKAIPVLEEALSLSNTPRQKKEVYFLLLKLYDRFGKSAKHYRISLKIENLFKSKQLSKDEIDKSIFQLKKRFGILQKNVLSKAYKTRPKIQKKEALLTKSYANMIATFSPKERLKYKYYAADSLYIAKLYSEAFELYKNIYDKSPKRSKMRKMSLEGISACLLHLKDSKNDKVLVQTYLAHLEMNPKNKKAHTIYQRLFKLYIDKKEVSKAEGILVRFAKVFPRSKTKVEAMLAHVMDHYVETKNLKGLQRWYAQIKKGNIRVGKKYYKKVSLAILTLQFKDVEVASSKGDKKNALIAYITIYRDKESNDDARKNAAYNIAHMFYLLGDTDRTYQWTKRAFSHMDSNDINEFKTSFESIAITLFEKQSLSKAFDIYEVLIDNLCRKSPQVVMKSFISAFSIALAEKSLRGDNYKAAEDILSKARRCNVSNREINVARLDLLKSYLEDHYWNNALKQYRILKKNKKNWPELIYPAFLIGKRTGMSKITKEGNWLYQKSKSLNFQIPLEAADVIANNMVSHLQYLAHKLTSVKLSFPEKKYEKLLKRKFKSLANLQLYSNQIIKVGSPRGVTLVYKILIESYKNVINDVETFVPPGKTPAFVKSFKGAMSQITRKLHLELENNYKIIKNKIDEFDILSKDNVWFYKEYDKNIQYRYLFPGAIMDRAGFK